jgi:membrane-associated HD superfamily phosphohydrolase
VSGGRARERTLRIYRADPEVWTTVEQRLRELPDKVANFGIDDLPIALKTQFKLDTDSFKTQIDSAALTALDQYRSPARRKDYDDGVHSYVESLRKLIVIASRNWTEEIKQQEKIYRATPQIDVDGIGTVELSKVFTVPADDNLVGEMRKSAAKYFKEEAQLKLVAFTANLLKDSPTHVLDEAATAERQNQAANDVPASKGLVVYRANQPIKSKQDRITDRDWQILQKEHEAFVNSLPFNTRAKSMMGIVGIVGLVTLALCSYVAKFQPRVVKNHARAMALAGLLLAMLLMAQLAGIGTGPLYLFAIAPTILVAMILAVAYDRRFAMGVATLQRDAGDIRERSIDGVFPGTFCRRAHVLFSARRHSHAQQIDRSRRGDCAGHDGGDDGDRPGVDASD